MASAGSKPERKGGSARKAATQVHRVKSGQNLSTIARRYDTTVPHLLELNGLSDAGRIRAGMKLKVPAV